MRRSPQGFIPWQLLSYSVVTCFRHCSPPSASSFINLAVELLVEDAPVMTPTGGFARVTFRGAARCLLVVDTACWCLLMPTTAGFTVPHVVSFIALSCSRAGIGASRQLVVVLCSPYAAFIQALHAVGEETGLITCA